MSGPTDHGAPEPHVARGSDAIRGRTIASAAVARGLTLVLSGIPTVLAWALMSKRLGATDFSGVALAVSMPTLSNFIIPAMGARIANSVALGQAAFEDAVARSVRACVLAGAVLIATSVAVAGVGWSRVLGRRLPDPFPMDFAVVFVSVAMAVWIVLLVGERILIARGENTQRVLANAVTGPFTLLGVLLVGWVHGPAWAYVIPLPGSMVLAAACSLVLALRLPGVSRRTVFGAAHRRPSAEFRASNLTFWLILTEAAVLVPIWMLRPVLSVRGTDADVASLSLALQFATPVLSLLAVIGQGLWPFYARNRLSLRRRDVLRHIGVMAAVSAATALCYVLGLLLLFRLHLIGHRSGLVVLVSMAVYIVCRGAWEPPRIVFSSDRTSRPLALLSMVTCALAVLLMWLAGGRAHGALAVLAVSAAFAALSLGSATLLMGRLHGPGRMPREAGDDVSTTAP